MNRSLLFLAGLLSTSPCALAFAPTRPSTLAVRSAPITTEYASPTALHMSDAGLNASTKEKLTSLVEDNPVLLFMKGSKLFPQCGFSNTACQILGSYNIEFESVDVLADEEIRSGIKIFSQWPTIPQLYVCGEFIGGSDIMIEMYQSGELGEMIEKAKADMM
eukprot:CAMPEP_0201601468 /NCGR_PEP_ID=MMETSP0492-20130828/2431_1 /ASSEMBLY_ACC=CAM_ASM_000837 /TAXON_ID=420259 /ORGANISM="Thalassiosira gravida, Strain GMp14c1" /LENGTH=161 /DNA_ID=CAMNT_0048064699 /DNA_START=59 /DNA_END=544 /DNA_ORIENTATION=-